jgi:hypothetical protein
MRHNESDHPAGRPVRPNSNQDHKLAARVASDFGLQGRASQSDYFLNLLLHNRFQLRPPKERSVRIAALQHAAPECVRP